MTTTAMNTTASKRIIIRRLTLEDKETIAKFNKDVLLYPDCDFVEPLFPTIIAQPDSFFYGLFVNEELVSTVWFFPINEGKAYAAGARRTKPEHQRKGYSSILIPSARKKFLLNFPDIQHSYGAQVRKYSSLRQLDTSYLSRKAERLQTVARYYMNGYISSQEIDQYKTKLTSSSNSTVETVLDAETAVNLLCNDKASRLDELFPPKDQPFLWNDQACFLNRNDVENAMERCGVCFFLKDNAHHVAVALASVYPFRESVGCCVFDYYGPLKLSCCGQLLAAMLQLVNERFPSRKVTFVLHLGMDAAFAEKLCIQLAGCFVRLKLLKDTRGDFALISKLPVIRSAKL